MLRPAFIMTACLSLTACGSGIDKKPNTPSASEDDDVVEVQMSNNGTSNNGTSNNAASNNTAEEACVRVSPNELEFGPVRIGEFSEMAFELENCSADVPLRLDDLTAPDDFEVVLPAAGSIEPQQSVTIPVVLAPTRERDYASEIEIATNAGPVAVSVVGESLSDECPRAVAKMFTSDDPTSRDGGTVSTLTTVTLSAAASDHAEEEITAWEWTLVNSPTGSASQLSATDTEMSTLYADTAGRYEVELRVFTATSSAACPADRLTFEAIPDDGGELLIQLTWDTPADPDQTDASGADLDLHWLHPLGNWDEAPYDCFWLNVEADWGEDGVARVDIDDTDGAGPESISHTDPGDKVYRAGIYYFSDNGYGPSYATLRIFIDGVQEFEEKEMFLGSKDQFLHGIEVDWSQREVHADHTVTSGYPVTTAP